MASLSGTGYNLRMDERRADLHNHTTCSDGDYTPRELVAEAARLGLAAVAVTDHDTIEGLPEAVAAGAELGVDVVCGVEVSLRFIEPGFRGSLHLLLYLPEALLDDGTFLAETAAALAECRGPKLDRARLSELNDRFGPDGAEPLLPRPLTEADLLRHGARVSRRHFALALVDLGFSRADLSRMLGNDSPAYVPSGTTVGALSGYLARWPQLVRVLAHPAAGSFPGDSHYKQVLPPWETVRGLLPRLRPLGLDGLEAAYPGHTDEWERRVREEVARLGLPLATGGSDCHGPAQRPLGVRTVPYAVVEQLRALAAARSSPT